MAKHEKKVKPRSVAMILVVAILAVIVPVIAFFAARNERTPGTVTRLPQSTGQSTANASDGADTQASESASEETAEPDSDAAAEPTTDGGDPAGSMPEQLSAMEFPLSLEDGKLTIENLFQYEGMNPDFACKEGVDVASIVVKNQSGEYLAEASIALTLADGTKVNFQVQELPAGKAAMAFAVDNASVEADAVYGAVACEARWERGITPLPQDLAVAVDGVTVTVTNNTGRSISKLVVYCRCPLDEEYFGGIAYPYTINDLPAGESATIEAWDCLLGMAEVVRIAEIEE